MIDARTATHYDKLPSIKLFIYGYALNDPRHKYIVTKLGYPLTINCCGIFAQDFGSRIKDDAGIIWHYLNW